MAKEKCSICDRKEKRIAHLEKQLSKLKKQVVRSRQRLSELEYLAREVEFIAAREEIEDLLVEAEDTAEELDKPPQYDILDDYEDEYVEVTRFDIPTGKMVTEVRKKPSIHNTKFKEVEKLSYSRAKCMK